MKHKILLLSLFIFALSIFVQTIQAQPLLRPGMPDPFFGTDGRVLTVSKTSDHLWYTDFELLPDAKIVNLNTGYFTPDGSTFNYHFILTRYNADGTLDNEFGTRGVKYIPIEMNTTSSVIGNSITVLPDGKMLIAAVINRDFALLRVDPNGEPDASFGVGGIVTTDFAGPNEISHDSIRQISIRPDGKIIAFGESRFDSTINPICPFTSCSFMPSRNVLARYNADGSLDTTFGTGGIQTHRFSTYRDYPSSLFIQPDGKLSVISYFEWGAPNSVTGQPASVRYNENGTVDMSYGTGGYLAMPWIKGFFTPLTDGRMLYVTFCYQYAQCSLPSNVNTRIERYNADFTPDASFPAKDYFLQVSGIGVQIQPDGKILIPAAANSYGRSVLYRFNADGGVDVSFGENGALVYDLDGSTTLGSYGGKIVVQPDGKILTAGKFYQQINGGPATPPEGIVLRRFIGRSLKRGFPE